MDYRARANLIYNHVSPSESEIEAKMDDSTLDADETVSASIDLAQLALRSSGHILHMVEGPGAPRVITLLDERDVVGRSLEASIHVPQTQEEFSALLEQYDPNATVLKDPPAFDVLQERKRHFLTLCSFNLMVHH